MLRNGKGATLSRANLQSPLIMSKILPPLCFVRLYRLLLLSLLHFLSFLSSSLFIFCCFIVISNTCVSQLRAASGSRACKVVKLNLICARQRSINRYAKSGAGLPSVARRGVTQQLTASMHCAGRGRRGLQRLLAIAC